MSDQDTEQEPSIEEILSSIRQIISDEDEDASVEEAAPPPPAPEVKKPEPEPEPEVDVFAEAGADEDDVIELTEKVEDDEPPPPPKKPIEVAMREAEEDEPEADIWEEPEADVAPEPEPEPAYTPAPKPERTSAMDDDSIFTRTAEAAALSGFSELARKTAVEHNGITLEEIVRTELKPMLRDWLDSNLPPIIERLVREELERVSKRVMED